VSKQTEDSATPYPPIANSVHTEVTPCPEYASTPTTPMLRVILELFLFWRLQPRARQPRQQIIPDLRRLLRCQIFPHVHNVSRLPVWVVMDRCRFSYMQSQQSSTCNRGRYNKSTHADHAVTKITSVQFAPMHTVLWILFSAKSNTRLWQTIPIIFVTCEL